ncbi:sulfatase-like hydrolase/transferase [Myxococcota bacterium]|nr:sulfatase-like hydrolase/transferase [Myxococcota bacterium]
MSAKRVAPLITGLSLALLGALEGLWAAPLDPRAILAAVGLWLTLWPITALAAALLEILLRRPALAPLRDARRWPLLALLSVAALLSQRLLNLALALIQGRLMDHGLLPPLAATLATLTALGALLCGALLWPPLCRISAGRPWLWVVEGLIALGAGLAALDLALETFAKDLSALRLGLLMGWGLTLWLAAPLSRAWAARRAMSWAAWLRGGGVAVALLGLIPLGLSLFSGAPRARQALADGGGVTPWIAAGLWALRDEDGDGFSPWLGGGDCDDAAPQINPGAYDLPEDGVDQDCVDGDAAAFARGERAQTRYAPRPPAFDKRWNLILLTIEATRPDHLSLYGYARPTTPQLEALAPSALVFDRAYTPANATRYALPTLLAGRLFGELEVLRAGHFIRVLSGNDLLFERLRRAGWRAEAVLSAELWRGMLYGMERGFDAVEAVEAVGLRDRGAEVMLKATLDAVERGAASGQPWAVWSHWMDPHEPYLAWADHDLGRGVLDRYDAEIAATDAAIGRLVAGLKARALDQDTILAITSDHGEEFGDHGGKFHGKKLFEESIRVPMLIYIPGAQGQRIAAPVSTLDLTETLGNLMGLAPGPDYSARSHAGRLWGEGEDDWRRLVFIDCIRNPERPRDREVALIEWPYKATVDFLRGHERLFDLQRDPQEAHDLRESDPARFQRLAGIIKRESARHQGNLAERLKARWISKAPPAWAKPPVEVIKGLNWLGSRVETRRDGARELHTVINLFQAAGPRPDLEIQLTFSGGGLKDSHQRYRPLAGLYPTPRWIEGEILTDTRLVRFVKRIGEVRVSLSVIKGGQRVWGPVELGALSSWRGAGAGMD